MRIPSLSLSVATVVSEFFKTNVCCNDPNYGAGLISRKYYCLNMRVVKIFID